MLVFGTTEMKEGNMKKKKRKGEKQGRMGNGEEKKKTNNLTLWK